MYSLFSCKKRRFFEKKEAQSASVILKNAAFLKKGGTNRGCNFKKRPFSQITIRNSAPIFRLSRFFNLRILRQKVIAFFQGIEKTGLQMQSGCFGGDGGGRTRVRELFHRGFSKLSFSLNFP